MRLKTAILGVTGYVGQQLIGKTSRKNIEQWIDRVFRTATAQNV